MSDVPYDVEKGLKDLFYNYTPPDYSPKEEEEEPSGDKFNRFVRGASGIPSDILKAVGTFGTFVDKQLGLVPEDYDITNTPVWLPYGAGQAIENQMAEWFPINEDEDPTFGQQLASGAGTVASFALGGLGAKALGTVGARNTARMYGYEAAKKAALDAKALGLAANPSSLRRIGTAASDAYLKKAATHAQNTGVMFMGAGATAQNLYDDAIANGASEEEAMQSFFWGAGLGTTEALPIIRALNRIDDYVPDGVKAKYLSSIAKGAVEEGTQEFLQTLGENVVAKDLVGYDEERGYFVNTGEATGVGATLGGALNAITGLFGLRRANRLAKDNKNAIDSGETSDQEVTGQLEGPSDTLALPPPSVDNRNPMALLEPPQGRVEGEGFTMFEDDAPGIYGDDGFVDLTRLRESSLLATKGRQVETAAILDAARKAISLEVADVDDLPGAVRQRLTQNEINTGQKLPETFTRKDLQELGLTEEEIKQTFRDKEESFKQFSLYPEVDLETLASLDEKAAYDYVDKNYPKLKKWLKGTREQAEIAERRIFSSLSKSPFFNRFIGGTEVAYDNGVPRLVYHATASRNPFEQFMPGTHFGTRASAEERIGNDISPDNRRVIPGYLNIQNPLVVEDHGSNTAADYTQELVETGILEREDVDRIIEAAGPEFKEAFLRVVDRNKTTLGKLKTNWEKLWNNKGLLSLVMDEYYGAVNPKSTQRNVALSGINQDMQEELFDILEKKGYDGFVYRNTNEDDGSLSYVAFRPEQFKSVFNERFDPEDQKFSLQNQPRTEKAQASDEALRSDVQNIYNRILPKGAPKLSLRRSLRVKVANEQEALDASGGVKQGEDFAEVAGYYDPTYDLIALALNRDAKTNAAHEPVHFLFEKGMFTDEEHVAIADGRQTLVRMATIELVGQKNWDKLNKKAKDSLLNKYQQSLSNEEAFAYSAARYDRMTKQGKEPKNVKDSLKSAWRRFSQLLRQIRSSLSGHGFNTLESVFERYSSGKVGSREAGQSDRTSQEVAEALAGVDLAQQGLMPITSESVAKSVKKVASNPDKVKQVGNKKILKVDPRTGRKYSVENTYSVYLSDKLDSTVQKLFNDPSAKIPTKAKGQQWFDTLFEWTKPKLGKDGKIDQDWKKKNPDQFDRGAFKPRLMSKIPGLSAGEAEWVGLVDFLTNNRKQVITKERLQEFVDANRIKVNVVRQTGPDARYKDNVDSDIGEGFRNYLYQYPEYLTSLDYSTLINVVRNAIKRNTSLDTIVNEDYRKLNDGMLKNTPHEDVVINVLEAYATKHGFETLEELIKEASKQVRGNRKITPQSIVTDMINYETPISVLLGDAYYDSSETILDSFILADPSSTRTDKMQAMKELDRLLKVGIYPVLDNMNTDSLISTTHEHTKIAYGEKQGEKARVWNNHFPDGTFAWALVQNSFIYEDRADWDWDNAEFVIHADEIQSDQLLGESHAGQPKYEHPFDQNKFALLAVKDMLVEAVEKGATAVTWSLGSDVNKRWGKHSVTSKSVQVDGDGIYVEPSNGDEELAVYLPHVTGPKAGQYMTAYDVAMQPMYLYQFTRDEETVGLIQKAAEDFVKTANQKETADPIGVDIPETKFEDQGNINLYDRQLRDATNKLLKQLGVKQKVERFTIGAKQVARKPVQLAYHNPDYAGVEILEEPPLRESLDYSLGLRVAEHLSRYGSDLLRALDNLDPKLESKFHDSRSVDGTFRDIESSFYLFQTYLSSKYGLVERDVLDNNDPLKQALLSSYVQFTTKYKNLDDAPGTEALSTDRSYRDSARQLGAIFREKVKTLSRVDEFSDTQVDEAIQAAQFAISGFRLEKRLGDLSHSDIPYVENLRDLFVEDQSLLENLAIGRSVDTGTTMPDWLSLHPTVGFDKFLRQLLKVLVSKRAGANFMSSVETAVGALFKSPGTVSGLVNQITHDTAVKNNNDTKVHHRPEQMVDQAVISSEDIYKLANGFWQTINEKFGKEVSKAARTRQVNGVRITPELKSAVKKGVKMFSLTPETETVDSTVDDLLSLAISTEPTAQNLPVEYGANSQLLSEYSEQIRALDSMQSDTEKDMFYNRVVKPLEDELKSQIKKGITKTLDIPSSRRGFLRGMASAATWATRLTDIRNTVDLFKGLESAVEQSVAASPEQTTYKAFDSDLSALQASIARGAKLLEKYIPNILDEKGVPDKRRVQGVYQRFTSAHKDLTGVESQDLWNAAYRYDITGQLPPHYKRLTLDILYPVRTYDSDIDPDSRRSLDDHLVENELEVYQLMKQVDPNVQAPFVKDVTETKETYTFSDQSKEWKEWGTLSRIIDKVNVAQGGLENEGRYTYDELVYEMSSEVGDSITRYYEASKLGNSLEIEKAKKQLADYWSWPIDMIRSNEPLFNEMVPKLADVFSWGTRSAPTSYSSDLLDIVKQIRVDAFEKAVSNIDYLAEDLSDSEYKDLLDKIPEVTEHYYKKHKQSTDLKFSLTNESIQKEDQETIDSYEKVFHRDTRSWGERVRDWIDYFKEYGWLSFKQGFFDQFASLREWEKDIYGEYLDASISPWRASLMSQNLDSVMNFFFQHGPTIYNAEKGIFEAQEGHVGLLNVFQPLVENDLMDQWAAWMVAKRAQRLTDEGRQKLLTQEDMDKFLALKDKYAGTVDFEAVDAEWQKFNTAVLDMAESAGVIDPDTRPAWESTDYVPFYRVIEDSYRGAILKKGPIQHRGIANQKSGMWALYGGTDKQVDPFEGIVMNMAKLVDASYKNVAMLKTANMLDGSDVLEELDAAAFTKSLVPVGEMKRALRNLGFDVSRSGLPGANALVANVMALTKPQGNNIVSVMVGGKPKYYRVNDQLTLQSLTGMNYQLPKFISQAANMKTLFTNMITHDPGFMLANIFRDTASTFVVTGRTGLKDVIAGAIEGYKGGDNLKSIVAAGGGGFGFYRTGPEDMRKNVKRLHAAGKQAGILESIIYSPVTAWRFLERLGRATEMANRIAIRKHVLRNGGTEAEAAAQAQDVLNFSMRGNHEAVRWLTATVPFMNARMQGLYRLGRGAKEDPKGFFMRGAALTAATAALYAANADDDRYKQLEDWDKDTYYHIWLDNLFPEEVVESVFGESPLHLRIPKPFEVGAIFSTVLERALLSASGTDESKHTVDAFLRMITDTFALNPLGIQVIWPLLEQWANKNTFTDRPIIGIGDEGLRPPAQYDPITSMPARAVAQFTYDLFGEKAPEAVTSPKRLEHLVNGYFGTMGGYILAAADGMVRLTQPGERPSLRIDQMPVFKRFLQEDPAATTRFLTDFYDLRKSSNEVYRTIQKYREEGKLDKAREFANEDRNKRLLQVRNKLNIIHNQLTLVRDARRQLYDNPLLTAEVKRRMDDQLISRRNDIASRVEGLLRKVYNAS